MMLAIVFNSVITYASKNRLSLAIQKKSEAQQFKEDGDFLKAGNYYKRAVQLGLSYEFGQWKAIDSYIKAKKPDMALQLLKELADSGNTEIAYFESLTDYYKDQNNNHFREIIEQVRQNIIFLNNKKSKIQDWKSKIHTQDIDHFFLAFDQAKNTDDIHEKKVIYEKIYFDQASVGMVDYISMKVNNIDSFVEHIESNRDYYEDVRIATKKIKSLIPETEKAIQKMKHYLPQATTPNIFFIVGMHTSAGTASSNGILLGADFIATNKKNTQNLAKWTFPFITTAEDKVWVVIHEYVHTLQDLNHADVLGNALVEGGADFLANLLYTPSKQIKEYTVFGLANECMIKNKFIEQMNSKDISMWTGNNGDFLPENWVPDLGYFIGHQIAQAFYKQATDKNQAIKDLIELKDPKAILSRSGYIKLGNKTFCE